MKRILLTICTLLMAACLNAQTNGFDVSEDGKVYWQKVYDVNIPHDDLLNIIVNNGNFFDINDGDVITFRVVRGKIDVEDYGYKRMSVPMYVVNFDVSCFVTIQQKENKYRVTADNITLVRNITTRLGEEGDEQPIETWAVKKGQMSDGFAKTPSLIYNEYFSKLFLFQPKSYLDNEW